VIPKGIQVEKQGDRLIVKGSKGVLEERIHPDMKVVVEGETVRVERPTDNRSHRSLHGLTRNLIQNMVIGLTTGYEKKLEIVGVGFKAELKGKTVAFQLGYSHPVYFRPPEGITIVLPTPSIVVIKGFDKALVGLIAAKIRSFKKPEPYKGKGIRYEKEHIRKKAGKATV
jgi:large subunit ribosomal protein L6